MGHHRKDVPGRITDARNISQRPIWICFGYYISIFIAIPENYLAVCFELVNCFFICIVAPFAMSNGYFINIIIVIFYKNVHPDKLLVGISQEDARKQM